MILEGNKNKYNRIETKNLDTGEIINTQIINKNTKIIGNTLIAEGTKNKINSFIDKKELSDFINDNFGTFYHLAYKYKDSLFNSLQAKYEGDKANIHIVRFIVLGTYLTFGGKLFDKNNNEIKKSSLGNIWNTQNRNGINETYKLLMECGYIYETEEGYIMINDNIMSKGKILLENEIDNTYTRVFKENIQKLFEGSTTKQQKQLANLFKVLPYINFRHNIFCSNPTETDINELETLTWSDLAELCGYDKTNVTRFKKDLFTLEIHGEMVIGQFTTQQGYYICVNPKVYYANNEIECVKGLLNSFKLTKKNKK